MGVCLSYLSAGIGTSKQHTGGLAGESGGLAGLTKVAQSLDEVGNSLLLAEAGLDISHQGNESKSLGEHVDD